VRVGGALVEIALAAGAGVAVGAGALARTAADAAVQAALVANG
jgi:hypothetical protein